MSDSIFDRLFELFQSPGPVNWKLAAEVRKSLAGELQPVDPSLAEEYRELALAAQLRLASATTLDLAGPGELQPVDGGTWAAENEQSYRFVIEPLAGKFTGGIAPDPANPMAAMLTQMGPALLGMQAGTMVGFLAHRVLGQFDAGLPALDHDELYLVVPNVEAFAGEHGLDHRQVRLWAAAHEVIHHAILAIPWVRSHLVAVMDDYYAAVSFDPGKLTDALAMVEQPDEIEEMIGGAGGLSALLGGESDPELLAPIQALLATIEGYGDHVVRQALEEIVPDLTRLEETAGRRRAEPSQAAQFLQQLVGLDLERHRARDAAALFAEIDRRWGEDAVGRVWTGPESLPTRDELTDPVGWAARVLLDD